MQGVCEEPQFPPYGPCLSRNPSPQPSYSHSSSWPLTSPHLGSLPASIKVKNSRAEETLGTSGLTSILR